MKILVNGEPFEHNGEPRLGAVLSAYGVAEGTRVAVVVGDAVIPREEHKSRPIREGDRIEILVFAGGG